MELKKIIDELKGVVENPVEYLKELKDKGKKIVLYTCSYVPEEIIWACGFHPARVIGFSSSHDIANTHLQPYSCPVSKSILEDLLQKKLPADQVIFSNTCDTMQRISDIVRLNTDMTHFDFMAPARLDLDIPRKYFYKITINLLSNLKKISGYEGRNSNLEKATSLFNNIRRMVLEISRINATKNMLSNSELYAIQLAGMIMDREIYEERIGEILEVIKSFDDPSNRKKRIILTGSMCYDPGIYELLDELGVSVVYNDMCSGIRPYEREVKEEDDLIKSIVNSMCIRPICPAKYRGLDARISHLKEKIKKYDIDGIIYLLPKFCDPHGFDLPDIKTELSSVPLLFLEIEQKNIAKAREKTRIQAFLELL